MYIDPRDEPVPDGTDALASWWVVDREAGGDLEDLPVFVTIRQAAAVVRLVSAAINGHDVRLASVDVEYALSLAILTAAHGSGVVAGDVTEAWKRVKSWPVPPAGPPRRQPR